MGNYSAYCFLQGEGAMRTTTEYERICNALAPVSVENSGCSPQALTAAGRILMLRAFCPVTVLMTDEQLRHEYKLLAHIIDEERK